MKKKSIIGLLLAVVMVFATVGSALTVFAEPVNKITIHPNGEEGLGGEDRFEAYEIFKGTLGTEENSLGAITWGNGVDSAALVTALKASEIEVGETTFGAAFTEAWTDWSTNHSGQYDEAMMVARFLESHLEDDAYARTFARIAGEHLKTDGYTPTKSTLNEGTHDWEINLPSSGYWLVKDAYTESSAAMSSYILYVAGEVEVDLKATLPTVDKQVEGADGFMTGTYEDVNFTLTGTVAENIGVFDSYSYKFIDKLSAGLTPNMESITVTLEANGLMAPAELTKDTDYSVTREPDDTTDAEHTITISFTDLKKVILEKVADIDLFDAETVASIKVVVKYTAQLNEHAVMGSTGNENTVTIEYSKNPYAEGTSTTTSSQVKTYTVGLKIVKYDEQDQVMANVEFKLKNEEGQYATFKKTEEDGEEVYTVTGWGDVGAEGTTLTTNNEGIFNVHGLDVGTYTFKEVKTTDGYEIMKPIEFKVSANGDDGAVTAEGALGTIELVYEDTTRDDVVVNNNDLDAHTAEIKLVNNPTPILPHTGGIGAGIIIAVSALTVVVGGGAVLFAYMKKKEQNN